MDFTIDSDGIHITFYHFFTKTQHQPQKKESHYGHYDYLDRHRGGGSRCHRDRRGRRQQKQLNFTTVTELLTKQHQEDKTMTNIRFPFPIPPIIY